jgi:hypothetical protein
LQKSARTSEKVIDNLGIGGYNYFTDVHPSAIGVFSGGISKPPKVTAVPEFL